MNALFKTDEFINWLRKLKDPIGIAHIAARLNSARSGNFGDHRGVGEGVMEMRIRSGPGYRIYYAQEGNEIYLLLIGGDKSSQSNDIDAAKKLWRQRKEEQRG